jgi:nickel-type superoxide dismutase maturation protease
MTPLLKPGDEVLIDPKAYQESLPTRGDIIVTQHPYRSDLKIIKRVELVLEDERCLLKGDNRAESTDSRAFGPVPVSQLLGRVTTRFG